MANNIEMYEQETIIKGLIGQYLAFKPDITSQTEHLDQDTLTAFVEGALNQQSAESAVSHLIDCSHCRRISAELIRLELEFTETVPSLLASTDSPTSVSAVLSGLFSKIFGTADNAVFAHSEEEKKKEIKAVDTKSDEINEDES